MTDVGSRSFDMRIIDGTKDFEIYDNTAGESRLIILNSGKVGIGTTTPGTDMDLVSDITDFRLKSTAGNSLFTMNADGGSAAFRLTDKSFKAYDVRMLDNTGRLDVFDKTLNQVRLSVTTNGNIGINDITPAEKLDVNGNIRLTGNIVSPNDICIGNCP